MQQKKRQKKSNSRHSNIYVIEAIVVIGLVLGVWIFAMIRSAGSGFNRANALEIDGEKYPVSDINYFYYAFYNSYREQNAEYLSYMFDESRSLKEQEYEDGVSWFSYFLDESIKSMVSVVKTADAAKEAGFELDETSRTQMQEYLDGVSVSAGNSGITEDEYVSRLYGEGMTLKRYGELMEMSFLAKNYTLARQESVSCTDEEIEKYYEEHRTDYDFVSYERLYFKASGPEEEISREEKRQAKETAEEALLKVREGKELKSLAGEYEDAVYYSTDDAYFSTGYAYGDWLFDSERRDGDSDLIEDKNGVYVLVFHGRSRHEYETVNIRDICFAVDAKAENPDEEYENSCLKAEDVYEQWKSGGATEELFAGLADEYSSSETSDGGLYTNLKKDSVDSFIGKWCFDAKRRAGDCDVVYTDNGFHVLYFVSYGTPAWKIEVDEDIRENSTSNWLRELTENVKIVRHEKELEHVDEL